ncbi:ABC transporter substrate-binding protein [uncultured Amnibacterium sp.]|uniref:ABC transporter substrate-binding protein n=1 Tax=uncultured Amnibacterium sp. TaxID=1631851 RepID=UPI0035CA2234
MRKKSAGLVLALSGVLALAGCSAAQTTPAGAKDSADLKGVTLTMWVAQSTATEAKQPIDAFEKKTGAVIKTVVIPDPYEGTVPTKLASGDKPDLAFYQPSVSALPVIQPANNLLPLDGEPYIAKLGKVEQTLGVINGVHYSAVIKQPSMLGVYYNKAVFAKAGITSMPTNYEDFIAVAKEIKAKVPSVAPLYEAGGDKWPLQWQVDMQLSGVVGPDFWKKLNENKASWTDPAFVNAVRTYDDDVIKGGLSNPDYKTGTFAQQGADLLSGKAAMVAQVDALVPLLSAKLSTKQLDDTIGWFPVAAKSDTAQFVADVTNGVSVFKTGRSQNEAAAKQFIRFWLGEDYPAFIKAQGYPSIEPAVPSPSGLPEIVQQAATAFPTATQMYYGYLIATPDIHIYLNEMIVGQKTPDTLAQAMQRQFVQQAKAQGAKGF